MPIASVSGIPFSNIASYAGNAIANIARFQGRPTSLYSQEWEFDNQTVNITSSGNGWSPNGTHANWASGTDACSDLNNRWFSTSTRTATGFRVDSNATASSQTGPAGAHDGSGGHDTGANTRYLFAETSGTLDTNNVFIARMPGFSPADSITDSTNNLNLKFYMHGYGRDCGSLYVYVATTSTSTDGQATLLCRYDSNEANNTTWTRTSGASTPSSVNFNGNSSNWQQITVSLNSIRADKGDRYIYFVYVGTDSFRGDLSLDTITIEES